MKIELEVSEENESTASPWWVILDPSLLHCEGDDNGIHNIAGMVTGPFFSREEAETELSSRRYDYGEHAVVYCCSGYWARQYRQACRNPVGK